MEPCNELGITEEFASLLAERDLQYQEMYVTGECWLQDTTWNRCLIKCADNLEKFNTRWTMNLGGSSHVRRD